MSNGHFFSENYIKSNTALSQNCDFEDLFPFIEVAQETLIRTRVGKSLYDRLVTSIINQDYNSDELELLTLIRPAAAFYTLYTAMPFLQTKIRNKGLVKGTDQYIQTVSREDMTNLRQEILQMSDFYMKKVDDYLCLYSNLFPEYDDSDPLNVKNYSEPFSLGGFVPYIGVNDNADPELKNLMIALNYRRY